MRAQTLILAFLLAGCAGVPAPPTTPLAATPCAEQPFQPQTLYLATGRSLGNVTGPAGEAPTNQGTDAFLGNVDAWSSAPVASGVQFAGNVTFEVWFRVKGAPLASAGGGQLFIQFGSDRAFVPGGVRAEAPADAPVTGNVVHANLTLALPAGGFTVEENSTFRLLVTSLVQGAADPGVSVLYGGDTPSQVRIASRCSEPREWTLKRDLAFPVVLPASQGAFAHAPPQEGVNRQTVPFDLEDGTARLTVQLRQSGGGRTKSDMDMFLLDGQGKTIYEGATPYANETMLLWPENLVAFMPPGHYAVRIDSYSGTSYTGKLRIVMEESE